jgi:DNA modification methylase
VTANFDKSGAVVAKFSGGLADGLVALRAAQKNGETTTYQGSEATGTSIFDPVLCELAYTWFCPPNGAVLDPFAGGSVRGIVAAVLGRKYTGIDLRPEQIEANEAQAAAIVPDNLPRWIVGDSREAMPNEQFDLVFSCPPYADLEVYSDDPRDISTMDYPAFMAAYRDIVAGAVQRLRNDRFACFVVGDVRDKKGMYYNFVSDTIAAFQDAGARLYNEAILVTAVGSLPIRVGKQFESGRKLGKTHQNVLVFVKGDPRKATQVCGPVEIGDLQGADDVGAGGDA